MLKNTYKEVEVECEEDEFSFMNSYATEKVEKFFLHFSISASLLI